MDDGPSRSMMMMMNMIYVLPSHRVELLPIVTEIDYIMSNLRKWMKPTYTPVPIWMAPGIILASMGDE